MKHPVTRFKSAKVCLKELEKFIHSGIQLYSGRALKKFGGMLPREMVANWLVCAVINADDRVDRLTFTSDPTGGDGVIYDTHSGHTWLTEHVMARAQDGATANISALIQKAVALKQKKGGVAYAAGKTLIVFLEGRGETPWYPTRVARALPKVDFDDVWVVGLQRVDKDGSYIYGITLLDVSGGTAPTWGLRIAPDFETWYVSRIQ